MNNLSNRIWITKRCRTITEKRLKSKSCISEILIIYYSFLLVVVSIYGLAFPNDHTSMLNMLLALGSIAVLIISVVISGRKYAERALEMRICYTDLDLIYEKCLKAENNNEDNQLLEIHESYSRILRSIENHSDYDYLSLRYAHRNDIKFTQSKLSCSEILFYYYSKGWRRGVIALLFMFPYFCYKILTLL
jgi:hypothetical protein